MLNEQTIATLNTLKLFGMARGFEVWYGGEPGKTAGRYQTGVALPC